MSENILYNERKTMLYERQINTFLGEKIAFLLAYINGEYQQVIDYQPISKTLLFFNISHQV